MIKPVRLDPFSNIVNVGWGDQFRYWVLELFSNSSSPNPKWGLPTTVTEIEIDFSATAELAADFFYPGGSINAIAHREFFQYTDYQAINTIAKRKALIDSVSARTAGLASIENYFLGTLECFFDVNGSGTGPILDQPNGWQIGYVFLLGKYAIDHPSVTHFETSLPDIFSVVPFAQVDKPFTEASLIAAGARNWGKALLDWDGAPHNPYP